MRQQTWFAVVVCTIAVIPGFIAGGLFKILMYAIGGWAENKDFLYLHALFGVDLPGVIYNFIFSAAVPNIVQAMIGGGIAVWLMEKIAPDATHQSAAVITGALYTGFFICLAIFSVGQSGVTGELLLATCQIVGLWVGLWTAAWSFPAQKGAVVNG